MNDTSLINDAPDALSGLTPLALLARLAAEGSISKDERDAGEIVARLAAFVLARPACDGSAHISVRDTEGKWSMPLLRGQEIKAKLDAALAAVHTPARRKAVSLALLARDRDIEWTDTSALSCGLEDLCRHFWPTAIRATASKGGVTLARVHGHDDATPERLQHANDNSVGADGVRRIVDSPFARMHARKQLDADAGINDILYSAGRNYFQDWYYSGLSGIGGIDYSRLGGGGDGHAAYMMPKTEFAAEKRESFRRARAAMPSRYRLIVDAIILEESTITSVAARIPGKTAAVQAIVRERLNVGLMLLAANYGLLVHQRLAA